MFQAESLCHSLAAVDASNEADTAEVEKQLKAVVNKEGDSGSLSVKKEKVCLRIIIVICSLKLQVKLLVGIEGVHHLTV